MKKLFGIAIVSIMLFGSCQKNKEYCWECTVTVYEIPEYHWQDSKVLASETTTTCGLTEDEINSMLVNKSNYPQVGMRTQTICNKR